MTLKTDLAAYDGRHTDVLEALAARLRPSATTIAELLRIADDDAEPLQAAATWLLKRFSDDGHAYSPDETVGLLDLLERATAWEAKLHVLQLLHNLDIPKRRSAALHQRLSGGAFLKNPNKFVRAWTYSGLTALAEQHGSYRPAVAALLNAAVLDEAPSARARIRNILKTASWAQTT